MSAATRLPPEDLFEEPARERTKQERAAADLAALVAPKLAQARKPKDFKLAGRTIEKARTGMHAMAESGDWGGATGAHLVALYEWIHEQVYGVAPGELDGKTWAIARQAAGRMVEQQFGGDYGAAVVFMRWAWKREQRSEQWRRETGKEGRRIGWRLQFHGALITDYKVDAARRSTQR